MWGLLKKTLIFLGLLAFKPITSKPVEFFPILRGITMVDSSAYPVVVLHGLESSSSELEPLCDWLETTFNKKVYNMEIGNGKKTSTYSSLNDQLDELCDSIYDIKELKTGFDFIGISQGGLLARGYVERCNAFRVRNLITFVTPHGGIYWSKAPNNELMYNSFFQTFISIASYWRNPTILDTYLTCCSYLPIINNEFWCNEESTIHRQNIRNLSNFVMIWSPNDLVLSPPESAKFSFYDEDFNVVPLEHTELYKNDSLGLKDLNYRNALHIYETNCSHIDHRNPVCFDQLSDILKRFL